MQNESKPCCEEKKCCLTEEACEAALAKMAETHDNPTVMKVAGGATFASAVNGLRDTGLSYLQIIAIASQIVEFIRTYGPDISVIVSELKKLYDSIFNKVSN